MNQAEIFSTIKQHRLRLVTAAAQALLYKWTDEFKLSEIARAGSETLKVDPSYLTSAQLIDLGFARWSEETDVLLAPLYVVPLIDPSTVMIGIDGEAVRFGWGIDNDIRFACVAFGVIAVDSKHRDKYEQLKLSLPKEKPEETIDLEADEEPGVPVAAPALAHAKVTPSASVSTSRSSPHHDTQFHVMAASHGHHVHHEPDVLGQAAHMAVETAVRATESQRYEPAPAPAPYCPPSPAPAPETYHAPAPAPYCAPPSPSYSGGYSGGSDGGYSGGGDSGGGGCD